MKKSTIDNLQLQGKAKVITSKDEQPRQVVASSNRLRVTFLKGKNNGKANS
tara:strand:+ start:8658 stop:8810 length:153 start_codon:yes stop_codon:yes gene_type:complete